MGISDDMKKNADKAAQEFAEKQKIKAAEKKNGKK